MNPLILSLGPFTLRWYGLMYVLALLFGAWLVNKECKRKNLPITNDEVMNFALICMFSGVFVARLYYVAFNWHFYGNYLWEIPKIWNGGLAIHGGMIGGLTGGLIFLSRHQVPTWSFADAVSPSIMLGQVFGRFGNFMNGDAHGVPTDMPWGIIFPQESIAGNQFPDQPIHPVMLYELFLNLVWFSILRNLRYKEYKPGFLFCLYFILYSIGRVVVSGYRADSLWVGSIRAAYLASFLLIVVFGSIIAFGRLWQTSKPE
ncbi:MAG: prolipoprotein diacylglyceryl transferase [Nitrospinota bacterium]|nr:prolipoprotein diacylglyceryl transferase [Nitrospinota bacterium]